MASLQETTLALTKGQSVSVQPVALFETFVCLSNQWLSLKPSNLP